MKISRNANQSGQGLVEYTLILVFIALVLIAALTFFGGEIGNVYSNIVSNI